MFIAVGTPTRRGDGHADLTMFMPPPNRSPRAMTGYAVIVTKSTVPVGTGRAIAEIVRAARPDLDFDVASNPEFLREGNAIGDFMRPDRVVIGAESDRAREVLRQLYRPLYLIETPIVFTGIETAELTKYAANAFLAMKVTFINEMSDLCEKVGADVHDVARGIGLDGRIGRKFLHPGPGYRRLLLSQGHAGPGAHRAGLRRALAAGGGHRRGQRRAQVEHGDAGDQRLRRLGARQDDRCPRPDLQAGDRRHARRARAVHRRPAGRRRRHDPRLRPRRDAAGPPAAARMRDILPRCVRCGAGAPTRWS